MKKVISLVLVLVLLMGIVPAQADTLDIMDLFERARATLNQQQVVRITHTRKVNVRSGPSAAYQYLGEASPGDEFPYLGTTDGWHRIQFTSTVEGYVSGNLSTVEYTDALPTATPAPVDGYVHITNRNPVNVRRGPSSSYGVICEVQPGDCYPYMGTSCGWHRILLDDATYGYVYSDLTELEGYEWEIDDPEISEAPGSNGGSSGGSSSGGTCRSCSGSGWCKLCHGRGGTYSLTNGNYYPCGLCYGMGRCSFCRGTGRQ